MLSLLATIWQADAAFPSGAFAFSNGIEGAAALGETLDGASLAALLAAALHHRWATAERVALLRAFRAAGDLTRMAEVDRAYDAATLAEPLRHGSRRNGAAFLTAHGRIGTKGAAAYRAEIAAGRGLGHLAVAQGLIWRACGLDERSAVVASGYVTASGLLNAAVRLGNIGAVAAQAVLVDAFPVIAQLASGDLDDDAEIASMTPWLDIAVTRHSRADLRLFVN
jgi:urease accessory protein